MLVRSEAARTVASAAGTSRAPVVAVIQEKKDDDGGDGTVVVDVQPSDELVVEANGCQGCSLEAWEIPASPVPKAEHVSTVVLPPKAALVPHSSPPVAGTAKQQTTGQRAANTGPAKPSHAVGTAPSPTAAPITMSPMSAKAGDAMAQAAAALDHFNALRASLSTSRGTSLEPSPSAFASCGEAAGTVPPAAPADDLRRLGRILSSGGGAGDSVMATESGQTLPSLPSLPRLPALLTMPSSSEDAIKPGSVADTVISSQQQPDGRLDCLFDSGLRETRFANGSIRRVLPGGVAVTRFPNGDVKRSLPGGVTGEAMNTVGEHLSPSTHTCVPSLPYLSVIPLPTTTQSEYWYAAVDSWQVSHPGAGVEVFYFASGQVRWLPSTCVCAGVHLNYCP